MENQYPSVYWPARQLANLYHDHWPGDASEGLKKSYDKWLDLDKRFSKTLDPVTLLNHRANYLESVFTYGEYTKTLHDGKLLERQMDDLDYKIPVSLLIYASALIKGDSKTALQELTTVEIDIGRLEKDHKAPWDYTGTIAHINSLPAQPWKKPLIDLLQAADKMQERIPIPQAVIDENKRLLAAAK